MSFLRILNVNINNVAISGVRIDFDVKKSNQKKTKEPNTAEIKIYNLAPWTRKKISELNKFVTLNAGHIDNIPAAIFTGIVRDYREENNNTEIISVVEVEDRGGQGSDDLYKLKRSISFPPLTSATSIIGSIAGFAGVPFVSTPIRDYFYISGFSYVGLLSKALDKVVYDALKMDWFIEDGKLFVEDKDFPNINLLMPISARSGLIGSPEKFTEEEDGKEIEKYKFLTLLNPRYYVGQSVSVISEKEPMTGLYKIESIRLYGSNYSSDFYNEYIVRAL